MLLSDRLLDSGEYNSGNAGFSPDTTGMHRMDLLTRQGCLYTRSRPGKQYLSLFA
jgi:hypothetical protein